MYKKPMDLIQEVEWGEIKRREKRPFAYLSDERESRINQVLCLPQPASALISNKAKLQTESAIENIKKVKTHDLCDTTSESSKIEKFSGSVMKSIVKISPSSIIGYLHVLLNASLISVLIYFLCYIIYFAKIDISYKIAQKTEEARVLIEEASRLYVLNRCDPTTRVPGMDFQCGQWDVIIKNGLSGVKYMRIIAEFLADILDGFVAKFSCKSLFTIIVMTGVCLIFKR